MQAKSSVYLDSHNGLGQCKLRPITYPSTITAIVSTSGQLRVVGCGTVPPTSFLYLALLSLLSFCLQACKYRSKTPLSPWPDDTALPIDAESIEI